MKMNFGDYRVILGVYSRLPIRIIWIYWVYIGIKEKKMDVLLNGLYRDNG